MIVRQGQSWNQPLPGFAPGGRTAFSLIEVAVAISILSVVLALSMTTIVALFRVERQLADDARHERAIARLASQFRDDAHVATAANLDGGCKLAHHGGRRIEYILIESGIARVVSQSGETVHRDSFFLGRGAVVSFDFAPGVPGRRLLQLEIGPASDTQSPRASTIRPLTIEAALHLHGRGTSEEMQP